MVVECGCWSSGHYGALVPETAKRCTLSSVNGGVRKTWDVDATPARAFLQTASRHVSFSST